VSSSRGLHELDGTHQPLAANLADMLMIAEA